MLTKEKELVLMNEDKAYVCFYNDTPFSAACSMLCVVSKEDPEKAFGIFFRSQFLKGIKEGKNPLDFFNRDYVFADFDKDFRILQELQVVYEKFLAKKGWI